MNRRRLSFCLTLAMLLASRADACDGLTRHQLVIPADTVISFRGTLDPLPKNSVIVISPNVLAGTPGPTFNLNGVLLNTTVRHAPVDIDNVGVPSDRGLYLFPWQNMTRYTAPQ